MTPAYTIRKSSDRYMVVRASDGRKVAGPYSKEVAQRVAQDYESERRAK